MSNDPSPWAQIVNQKAELLVFFGALGGMVRSATLKTTWKEGLRVVFVGSACSFGFGSLGTYVITPFVGTLPSDVSTALSFMCSGAFIMGLIGVTIAERFVFGKRTKIDDPNV